MQFHLHVSKLVACVFLALAAPITVLSSQPLSDTLEQILTGASAGILTTLESVPTLEIGGISSAVISPSGEISTAQVGAAGPGGRVFADSTRGGISEVSHLVYTVLTLALMEEGALMLSQPISDFIDASSLTNVAGGITIDQLIRQTSGLDDFTEAEDYNETVFQGEPSTVFTPEELTQLFVGLPGAMGSFDFSNTNFLVLGLVLEQANGEESINQSINRLLLAPAELSGLSAYDSERDLPVNLSQLLINLSGNPIPVPLNPLDATFTGASFAGNSLASPATLLQFSQALFSGQIISEDNLTLMTTFDNDSDRLADAYGVGIERFDLTIGGEVKSYVGYSGKLNYPTMLLYSLEDSVGVAITSNNFDVEEQDLLDVAEDYFEVADELISSIDPTLFNQAAFTLSPNPTAGPLDVSFELLESATVQLGVFNVNGQQVFATTPAQRGLGIHRETLELATLPAGAYFLRISVNNQATAKKFFLR